jgi:hypothetical protein
MYVRRLLRDVCSKTPAKKYSLAFVGFLNLNGNLTATNLPSTSTLLSSKREGVPTI